MKVILGEVDGAAIFRDERFRMACTAAWLIELQARMATEPDTRDCELIELCLKLIETVKESASWGQEGVYRTVDGNFGLQQEGASARRQSIVREFRAVTQSLPVAKPKPDRAAAYLQKEEGGRR